MLRRWLIINNGRVDDVVECEGNANTESIAIQFNTIQEDNDRIFSIGDDYDINMFLPTIEEKRYISIGSLFDRLGPEKYNILSSSDVYVQAFIKDMSIRHYVDLDRADVLEVLTNIQNKGFSIDAESIVSDPIQNHEVPLSRYMF